MNIVFDITKAHALNLGQQYDHNLTTVTFTGFVPEDTEHTIYLKFEGLGLYPLLDMTFVVSQAFTLKSGVFKGQLLEVAADETLIQNSKIFDIMVKPSLDENTEIVEDTPDMDLWFSEMSELYETVQHKLDSGEFNGKSAYDIAVEYGYVGTEEEWIEWVQNKITKEKIIEELGYTPADEENVPHVYDWALQETKPSYTYDEVGAMSADTVIPTKVSELENDKGYISDVSDKVNVSDYEEYTSSTNRAINKLNTDKMNEPENIGNIGQVLTRTHTGSEWASPDMAGTNYVLLNSTRLYSDTFTISFDTDSTGKKFDLKSVMAVLSNPNGINGGSNAICYVYDEYDNVIGDTPVYFYANASVIKTAVGASVKGAIVDMYSSGWSAAVYSPVIKSIIGEVADTGNIAKIELTGNGNLFRQGTVINIYGVWNV